MVCAPVRSIIPSLKLGDYLSVQAHNPWSISHLVSHNESYHVLKNFLKVYLPSSKTLLKKSGYYDFQNL